MPLPTSLFNNQYTPNPLTTNPNGGPGDRTPGMVNNLAPMSPFAQGWGAPSTQPGAGIMTPQESGAPPVSPYNFTYEQNPQSYNFLSGQWNNANPGAFATQNTAQQMSDIFGGQVTGDQLSGPGAFSTPMLQVGGANAAILADLVSKYGVDYARQVYERDTNPAAAYGGNAPQASYGALLGAAPGAAPLFNPTGSNPGTPEIFLPPPTGTPGTQTASPMTHYLGQPGPTLNPTMPPGGSADSFLADFTNNTGYLTNIAQNAGFATDQGPAWQAMVAAQQRGLDKNFANLKAGYAASGNRFSSDFGSAATDYWNQAGLDQNALLGSMTLQSQEAARARELQAAGQLSQQGFAGGQQLSSQGFQSQMQGQNQQLQAAMMMMQQGGSSANLMAQLGAQGAQGLQQGALTGAQGLFNTENNAASQEIQRQLMLQQMGLSSAQTASQLWQSNLGLGNQIGSTQMATNTAYQQAQMQEWLRTQPQYNPLLSMIYSSATGYPPTTMPQYTPNPWVSILSSIFGAAGNTAGAYLGR